MFMERMKVIDSRRYYPAVGVGFRVNGGDGDLSAETTKRPLVEEVARRSGFRIIGVTRERNADINLEYCFFRLESITRVNSHEAWRRRIHTVTDMFPDGIHSYTISPWQQDNLAPYLKACKLQNEKGELDSKSCVYKAAEKISKTIESVHDKMLRENPAEQVKIVRSGEFRHLANVMQYYLDWIEWNINKMS